VTFEDELRETMRAHDSEATKATDLLRRRPLPTGRVWLRPRTVWAGAAAAACVAALAVVVAVTRPTPHRSVGTTNSQLAACPTRFHIPPAGDQPWVPSKPRGIDASARLVPDTTPTGVVVCAYSDVSKRRRLESIRSAKLVGGRALGGDLTAVTETLTWQPAILPDQSRDCLFYLAPTDFDNYLIELTYPGATVWVSAPGDHCRGATNGVFATLANLGPYAAAASKAGHWISEPAQRDARPDTGPCAIRGSGRLGQETALVPGQPISVTVCTDGSPRPAPRTNSDPAALVAALNRLPTRMSDNECDPIKTATTHRYEMVFRYAVGPAMRVYYNTNCTPFLNNGSLQSVSAHLVMEQLIALHLVGP
jgi:hypothetical protein